MALVGDKMAETFRADILYIALYDAATGMIDFPYYSENGERRRSSRSQFGEGLTSHILRTTRAAAHEPGIRPIRSTASQGRRPRAPSRIWACPCCSATRRSASISVQSSTEEGRFGGADVRLLTTLAANVVSAIHNARLYSESQGRATEMAALADVGREMTATLELNVLLKRMAEQRADLLGGTSSAVFLPRGRRQDLPRDQPPSATSPSRSRQTTVTLRRGHHRLDRRRGAAGDRQRRHADARAVHIAGTPTARSTSG